MPAGVRPGSSITATGNQSVNDAEILALRALAFVASDASLGPRLLALTGIDAATLRQHAGERATLASVLGFLSAREVDLVTVAEALAVPPARLAAAARLLGGDDL